MVDDITVCQPLFYTVHVATENEQRFYLAQIEYLHYLKKKLKSVDSNFNITRASR